MPAPVLDHHELTRHPNAVLASLCRTAVAAPVFDKNGNSPQKKSWSVNEFTAAAGNPA